MMHRAFLLLPYALLSSASAVTSCCNTLSAAFPGKVSLPDSSIYKTEQSTYYSALVSTQAPACRFSPESTQDVSAAMKVLTKNMCKFAVRSGGHMVWPGASNTDAPGLTIDMGKLDSVTVSKDKSVASAGPGGRWLALYDKIATFNVTVNGARSNTVGVGGYLLGGGISHMNAQHGLAAQSILNYEIVLANGTITNANASSNSDLYTALHTGSTNFGIITRYDLQTYPLVPIFGGARSYNISQSRQFLDASITFMDKQVKDTKAGGIIISMIGDSLAATMAYYNGDGPLTDAMDAVLAIPTVPNGDLVSKNIDQQGLSALVDGAYPPGRRAIFSLLPFVADTQFALDINAKAVELFKPLEGKNISWAVTFQPFGKAVTSAISKTPNFAGIQTQKHLFIFGTASYHDDPALDGPVNKWAHDVVAWGKAESMKRGLFERWLYLNYAFPDQEPLAASSVGADNNAALKRVRDKYDPGHVLATLWTGGFKL